MTATEERPKTEAKKPEPAKETPKPVKAEGRKIVPLDMAAVVKSFLVTLQEQAQVHQARILSLQHGNTPRPPEVIRGGAVDQEIVSITFVVPRFTPQ